MARAARAAARPVRARTQSGSPAARRRFHVPTSVILTIVGGILTVLILPAVTRQWDDRQRAREIKVQLSEEVATVTVRTLGAGLVLYNRHTTRTADFQPLRTQWYISGLRIEAKSAPTFPQASCEHGVCIEPNC